jgi:hypothetical protein
MPRLAPRALFRALCEVGLDRRQLSIHEMLTDILEVVQVVDGSKPAHLAGQGEGAAWRMAAFERIAADAGLHVLRTAPIADSAARRASVDTEFPLIAAALDPVAERAPEREVLWIHRDPGLADAIGRLAAGDAKLMARVLGYPACCTEHEARSEADFVRALLRLCEEQHGLGGETAVLEARRSGLALRPNPAASAELEAVWRTRLVFPYLGHTACPACLARPRNSASARLNRRARGLAFRLDPAFAAAVWRTALAEAALATRGDCRALDPVPADPCPCGSSRSHADCCARRRSAMPEFR